MDTISAFMGPLSGSADPETLYNNTMLQWSSCGPVSAVKDLYGLPTPFVKDSGVAQLSYHPEFCQFVVETLENSYGVSVPPSQFPAYGIGLSLDASKAFAELAVGTSNVTHQDPLAQQFLYMFLMYDQATVLQHLGAASAPQVPLLSTVDANTWALLQGYMMRTMTEGGRLLFDAALVAGNGGMLVTRPLEEWLYGYEDPLLPPRRRRRRPDRVPPPSRGSTRRRSRSRSRRPTEPLRVLWPRLVTASSPGTAPTSAASSRSIQHKQVRTGKAARRPAARRRRVPRPALQERDVGYPEHDRPERGRLRRDPGPSGPRPSSRSTRRSPGPSWPSTRATTSR